MPEEQRTADHKKRLALERIKTATDTAISTVKKNPRPVDGTPRTEAIDSNTSGMDGFTKDLSDAWQSTKADEFEVDITSNVKDIRDQWDIVNNNVSHALSPEITDPEPKVTPSSEEAKDKWDRVP